MLQSLLAEVRLFLPCIMLLEYYVVVATLKANSGLGQQIEQFHFSNIIFNYYYYYYYYFFFHTETF